MYVKESAPGRTPQVVIAWLFGLVFKDEVMRAAEVVAQGAVGVQEFDLLAEGVVEGARVFAKGEAGVFF